MIVALVGIDFGVSGSTCGEWLVGGDTYEGAGVLREVVVENLWDAGDRDGDDDDADAEEESQLDLATHNVSV